MVDTIKFSEFSNGGDLENNETTVGLSGGLNTRYNNPWTFLKPGTTGDRPAPAAAMYYRLRFNTTLEVYEYYDPTTLTWTQLSGTGTGTVNPGVANDIAFYAANGQAVSPIASATNAVLVSNGSNVPSMSTTLPSGLSIPGAIITASTAALLSGSIIAAPVSGTDITNKTYVDSLVGGSVTSITGTTNQVIASSPTGAVTLSLPQDIALGSTPTFAGLTLTSIPLGFSSGGTNRNSLPLTPTASSYSAWDVNSNLSANSFIPGFATTVTAAGNTVLTVASRQIQEFTGSTTQTVTLPVASTLVAGQPYEIINNSSGNVTVQSSGGNTIQVMAANTTLFLDLVLASGTTAASWNAGYVFDNGAGVLSITGTANQVIASASTGAVTLSLPQDIAASSSPTFAALTLSSPLTAPNGGSGRASATAYAVICGGTTSTGAHQSIASVGTAGQVLTSNGAGALPTMQSLSASLRVPTIQKFLSGSGTYTTPTSPAPLYIRVNGVGGGGGGGGSGSAQTAGGTGGNTTFGTALLVANGGVGAGNGVGVTAGGAGGTASLGAAIGSATSGSYGYPGSAIVGASCGQGGGSFYGGAGAGGYNAVSGTAGATNSGGGGGGAGAGGAIGGGAGGGGGGYFDGIISSPAVSYSYAVGAAGTAGAAGAGGQVGMAGGSGQIVVYEYYQ